MDDAVGRVMVFESRFAVPPEFAARWLTDFRPDDGQRWFGQPGPSEVEKTPDGYRISAALPTGRSVNEIRMESPARWTARGRFFDTRGHLYRLSGIEETVASDGGTGTVHRVEIWYEPQRLLARLTFFFGRRAALRSLREGLARMKRAMEEDFRQPAAFPVPEGRNAPKSG